MSDWFVWREWATALDEPQDTVRHLREAWQGLVETRGRDDLETLRKQVELATALRVAGELEQARRSVEEALRALERGAPDHPLRLVAAVELGRTLLALSCLVEATKVLDQAQELSALHYDPSSPESALIAETAALAAQARGDLPNAQRLKRDLWQIVESLRTDVTSPTLDRKLVLVLGAGASLSAGAALTGVPALSASTVLRGVYEGLRQRRGRDDFLTAAFEARLGSVYLEEGEFERSLQTLREAVARVSNEAEGTIYSTYVRSYLVQTLNASPEQEHRKEGVDLAEEVAASRSAMFGELHPQTLFSKRLLSRAAAPFDSAFAVRIGEEAAAGSQEALGRGHLDTLAAYEELANLWDRHGQSLRAREIREENVQIRQADEGILGSEQPPIENLAGQMTELFELPETLMLTASPTAAFPGTDEFELPAESAAAPASAAVRRTAHVDLDPSGEIEAGGRFEVVVQVDCREPEGTRSTELTLQPPAGVEEIELRAWLIVTRHFEIEGESIRSLPLDLREESSPQLRFEVQARSGPTAFEEDPEVRVLFSYNGWLSGEASVAVPLIESTAEAAQ